MLKAIDFINTIKLDGFNVGAILTIHTGPKSIGCKFVVATTKTGRKWLKTHCKRAVELIRENPVNNYKIR